MSVLEIFKQFSLALTRPCFFRCWAIVLAPFFFLFSLSSCWWTGEERGFLLVQAVEKTDASFEVFRVISEQPLQLISEEIGKYNIPLALKAGSYLILGDCSSEMVVIKPSRTKELVSDAVRFIQPENLPASNEAFTIQCVRHHLTQSRQKLVNRFQLNVLRGNWEFLAGLNPIKFEQKKASSTKPQVFEYGLGALRVNSFSGAAAASRYFVSAQNIMVSVTASQNLGDWVFLPPGDYQVELNGTKMPVNLKPADQLAIEPAFLRISTPEDANIELAPAIRGNPLSVAINGGYWLNLNETYPALPGPALLRLDGSEADLSVELESAKLVEKKTRAIKVDLDCPPWDWTCLGSRKIYLYEKDAHYPFAIGVTDVPLLFFEKDAWLTIEGSRDIRYKLASQKDNFSFGTATVKLFPKAAVKAGVITDLLRVEAGSEGFSGNTLDLSLEHESTMVLLAGSYLLAEYHTLAGADGDRRKLAQHFHVSAGENIELNLNVYVSEKKIKQHRQLKAEKLSQRSIKRRVISQKYLTPRPLRAY